MIELSFSIKTRTVNEALDALTEIYLRTENRELQIQCEEYRERLASLPDGKEEAKDVPHRTERAELHECSDTEGCEIHNREGE